MISDDKNLLKEFSNFFDMTVKNLDVKGPQVSHINEDSDPIVIALNMSVNLVFSKERILMGLLGVIFWK